MIQLLKNTCLKEIIGITSKIIFLFFPDAFVHILYIQMCPLRRARRLWEGILKKRRWTPISPSQSKIQKESTVLKNCAMTLIKSFPSIHSIYSLLAAPCSFKISDFSTHVSFLHIFMYRWFQPQSRLCILKSWPRLFTPKYWSKTNTKEVQSNLPSPTKYKPDSGDCN